MGSATTLDAIPTSSVNPDLLCNASPANIGLTFREEWGVGVGREEWGEERGRNGGREGGMGGRGRELETGGGEREECGGGGRELEMGGGEREGWGEGNKVFVTSHTHTYTSYTVQVAI